MVDFGFPSFLMDWIREGFKEDEEGVDTVDLEVHVVLDIG